MTDPTAIDESGRESDVSATGRGSGPGPDDQTSDQDNSQFEDDQTLAEVFVKSVSAAIEAADSERVKSLCDELHPADLADLIGLLRDEERLALVELLGGGLPADVLAELDPDLTEDVINAMAPEKVAEAVAELDTDDAAFVLEYLDEERRAEILAEVPITDRLALNAAFEYEEDSAGRLMQREVFAAPAYWTVGQIIDRLRRSDDLPDRFYEVFVIDPSFKPIGAIPLSTLLRTAREVTINDIIPEGKFRRIPVTMDQEEVGYLFEQYNLISSPVVDDGDRLVGMITVDDVVEIVHEETHEDMLALGGVVADTGLSDTVFETVRSRFAWLAINLGTAIMASMVIVLFGGAIEQMVALAVLMPIIASMGGNAGTQTLTVAVRSLATKDLTGSNATRIVVRETLVGGMNGFLFAILLGLLAGAWNHSVSGNIGESVELGLVVGVAMMVNLLAAGLAGILIPLGLQRVGADPAVSSAVFVTTVTDIVGFFVFLGLAAAVLL